MAKKKFGEQPRTLDELDRFDHELLPQAMDKIEGAKFQIQQGRLKNAHHILDSATRNLDEAKTLELERIEEEGRTPGDGL